MVARAREIPAKVIQFVVKRLRETFTLVRGPATGKIRVAGLSCPIVPESTVGDAKSPLIAVDSADFGL